MKNAQPNRPLRQRNLFREITVVDVGEKFWRAELRGGLAEIDPPMRAVIKLQVCRNRSYFLASGEKREMKFIRKIIAIMLTIGALALFSGCVTANPNSEVMVDTSARKAKNVPNGASEPGDFEKLSDPFLMGN
jgi:hypothetical protein